MRKRIWLSPSICGLGEDERFQAQLDEAGTADDDQDDADERQEVDGADSGGFGGHCGSENIECNSGQSLFEGVEAALEDAVADELNH